MQRILIIDDSSFMRSKISNMLKADEYEIIEAEDGIKGLQIASSDPPDCILLDIIMPGMDGLKIIKTLREKGLQIPIIVVTADIQESTSRQCFNLGATAVVHKPPKEEELRDTIRKGLGINKETLP